MRIRFPVLILFALLLTACQMPSAAPTLSALDLAATAQAMAQVSVQQTVMAAPTAKPLPTKTARPQPTPTKSGGAGGCNSFSFDPASIDVTIPDGASVVSGTKFTKTWRIRNAGTCAWNANYRLVFSSGSPMGGPQSVKLGRDVQPGQIVDISVSLTAPTQAGAIKGVWAMQTHRGEFFGTYLTVSIRVVTPTPTKIIATPTPTCPWSLINPKLCKCWPDPKVCKP